MCNQEGDRVNVINSCDYNSLHHVYRDTVGCFKLSNIRWELWYLTGDTVVLENLLVVVFFAKALDSLLWFSCNKFLYKLIYKPNESIKYYTIKLTYTNWLDSEPKPGNDHRSWSLEHIWKFYLKLYWYLSVL